MKTTELADADAALTTAMPARAPLSVLIVDDSSMMRRVLRDFLAEEHYLHVVGEAGNGAEALRQVRQLSPDIILLDVEMPILDGIGFLREARLLTDARVIVISSVTALTSDRAIDALAHGAHDLVPKPSGAVSLDMKEERSDELLMAIRECAAGW